VNGVSETDGAEQTRKAGKMIKVSLFVVTKTGQCKQIKRTNGLTLNEDHCLCLRRDLG
jgi:hypothetical protein